MSDPVSAHNSRAAKAAAPTVAIAVTPATVAADLVDDAAVLEPAPAPLDVPAASDAPAASVEPLWAVTVLVLPVVLVLVVLLSRLMPSMPLAESSAVEFVVMPSVAAIVNRKGCDTIAERQNSP